MLIKPSLAKCIELLSDGFSLITVQESKIPNISWKQYQKKPMSHEAFQELYKKESTAGVGIITGYSDLECIDVDLKVFQTAKEKEEFWNELLQLLKDNIYDFERKFVIVKTRNAGFHILYKSKKCQGNKKIAKSKHSAEAVIESRGIGGYVWIYNEFIQGSGYNRIDYISDDDHAILWHCCYCYNYVSESPEPIPQKTSIEYSETGLKCWEDFNKRNNVWDIVSPDFVFVRRTKLGTLIKRNGAKSPHSGIIFEDTAYMFLHSTGTIYPHEKLITPFIAYTFKHHSGDFSNAAKQLYSEGYGDRIKKNAPPIIESKKIEKNFEFPVDVFPMQLQNYFLEMQGKLNHCIDYMATSYLWVVSMCIGNIFKVEVKKGWIEPAIIWAAVVGRAGNGKSHNIDNIIKPLMIINEREARMFSEKFNKYKEFKELDPKEKKKYDKVLEPKTKQFIIDDITIEQVIDMHESNPKCIGVYKDELTGWFKDFNKYRPGSDLEKYLSSFSGKTIIKNRVTAKSSYVPNSFISIIGGIQPEILSLHSTLEFRENGLLDRFLLCYPIISINYFNDVEISQEWLDWYVDCTISLKDSIDKLAIYTPNNTIDSLICLFEKDAKKQFIRVFNKLTDMENSPDESSFVKQMLPKQKTYLVRFSLILNTIYWHFCDGNFNLITKKSVLNAEKLVDYFIYMAKKNKTESIEKTEIKNIIKSTGKAVTKEKLISSYQMNPQLNITELCEQLNISRGTAYNWLKEFKK